MGCRKWREIRWNQYCFKKNHRTTSRRSCYQYRRPLSNRENRGANPKAKGGSEASPRKSYNDYWVYFVRKVVRRRIVASFNFQHLRVHQQQLESNMRAKQTRLVYVKNQTHQVITSWKTSMRNYHEPQFWPLRYGNFIINLVPRWIGSQRYELRSIKNIQKALHHQGVDQSNFLAPESLQTNLPFFWKTFSLILHKKPRKTYCWSDRWWLILGYRSFRQLR